MQEVTVGVVGYGYWGPNLVRNFHEDARVNVRYICDRSQQMLDRHRKRYPAVIFTQNFEDLLNDPALDAIVIATPTETHFDLAQQALKAGKHVLVEKPLCQTSDQCRELIALAAEKKLVLMVDHTFLYHGAVRLVKQLVDSGELGDLLYFSSTRLNLGIFHSDCNVLWDLASHDLSIMDFLLQRTPLSVHAVGACHLDNGVEDIAYLTLKFEDNLIAHFHCSWLSPVKIRQILVGGSRKMIVFDDITEADKIRVYDKGIETMKLPETAQERYKTLVQYRVGDMRAPVIDRTEALRVEAQHFVDCITDGRQPISDGESGLRIIRLLELAELSLKTGQIQPVDFSVSNSLKVV
jgi:predicted dehydrogenase